MTINVQCPFLLNLCNTAKGHLIQATFFFLWECGSERGRWTEGGLQKPVSFSIIFIIEFDERFVYEGIEWGMDGWRGRMREGERQTDR